MRNRPKAITVNLGPKSLASLGQAFPEWEIEATGGAPSDSLVSDPDPMRADLLIVGTCDESAKTLDLCRYLQSLDGVKHLPLLVMVSPGQTALVQAALDAGADGCLVLPIVADDLESKGSGVRVRDWPSQNTRSSNHAPRKDPLQDDGGEA